MIHYYEFVRAALAIIKRFWWLAPLAAAAIMFALWRGAEREADAYEARWKAEQQAHAVTRASVATLQAAINADNAEDAARGAALLQAQRDAATARQQAERAYAPTRRAIDALRASVGQNGADCDVPDEVREALR